VPGRRRRPSCPSARSRRSRPVGGLQDYLIVHYLGDAPGGPAVDGLRLWAFGDVSQAVIAERGEDYPGELTWNGEDDYGPFRYIETDTTDGANQDVGFIVVDTATGQKVGTEADRVVDPSVTPEVWVRPDSATTFTSQAAAQGFATVHYQRPDGDYTGWGLHIWGDAAAEGVATEWTSPRQPDGVDEFGAYWNVPVDDVDAALNFIIHKGDDKAQAADQTFVPADQPAAWVVQGDETTHPTRAAALDLAVIHYTRPGGDYDGWGLHTWTGSANPTEWTSPLEPVRTDRFGVVFEVPLVDGATSLSYILHKGDEKDLPDDQVLDLVTIGHEVWIISGREGYLLPVQVGAAEPGDLGTEQAQWLTRDIIAWDVEDPAAEYSLHTSADGGLELVTGGVGGGDSIELEFLSEDLPAELAAGTRTWRPTRRCVCRRTSTSPRR
jgi:hypothetical protein